MAAIETNAANGVLTLRIRRPDKKNAIDRAMYAAMTAALAEAGADAAIGAVVVAGEALTAEEAREARLVYRVMPVEEVERAAVEAAVSLAAKPREALRIARELVRPPRDEVLARIEEEIRHFEAHLHSAEAKAAFAAFTARR